MTASTSATSYVTPDGLLRYLRQLAGGDDSRFQRELQKFRREVQRIRRQNDRAAAEALARRIMDDIN